MAFNIIITAIKNPRSTTILAHHLAQAPGVNMQQARLMLAQLPLIYDKNLSKVEISRIVPKLRTLGVSLRIEESTFEQIRVDHAVAPPLIKQQPEQELPPPAEPPKPQEPPPAPTPYLKKNAPALHISAPHTSIISVETTPANKRRKTWVGISISVAVVIAIFYISGAGNKNRFAVKKMDPLTIQKKKAAAPSNNSRKTRAPGKEQLTGQQRQDAQHMVDSALQAGTDVTQAIKFYRMALSFNQYNVHAWYGLIAAYQDAGMHQESQKARREMNDILGDKTFTIAQIIAPFGIISELEQTPDGVLRIEYRTRSKERLELMRETWRIGSAASRACNCRAISLFASTHPGSGLLVYAQTDPFAATLESFQETASLTFLD